MACAHPAWLAPSPSSPLPSFPQARTLCHVPVPSVRPSSTPDSPIEGCDISDELPTLVSREFPVQEEVFTLEEV
jgi:hypothetical protein